MAVGSVSILGSSSFRISDDHLRSGDREMSLFKKILIAIGILLALGLVYTFMIGSGGFKRATTLTGWYAIADVGGYDVVCFHLKNSDVGNCLPKSQVTK